MKKRKNVLLTDKIIPIEYDIEIKPDLENFTFSGTEVINLEILKSSNQIVLHSKDIRIVTAEILINKEKIFASITYNEEAETAVFTFAKKIPVGKTKLTLVFEGILNDKMRGFYKSSYILDGKLHHMATTQFESTDARRAFPCFDEPAKKAIFHVSLVVPKGKTAISNTMPVLVKEHSGEFEVVKFSPTPKMSTYLLAFIVGDFEYLESKTKNGVMVRVFTTPGKKHQASFALDCAVRTLEFYEEYFDIKYPLPNLDMIAIPDFSAGAMENWGAITYRESALLVDPDHSSASNKQWVALVIAHELAHQWFGNLVTMEWWTHLWLNEGFASYIEYLAVDKLFPQWDIWTQFSTHDLGVALRLDALYNTHPIEIPVHHPSEIGEIFDEVSYSKGASVIRMLADYLGEKDFRDGLRHYLKKHSYKNTETEHLWEAFEKVSKKKVARVMREWTKNGGYPVIKTEIKNKKLLLSQERFFSSEIIRRKIKDKTIWQVPISIQSNDKTDKVFVNARQKSIPRENFDWLKVNIGEAGFYRTAYSKELLEKLKYPVENKLLSPRDRLGIIRDIFALAESGVAPTTDALFFLDSYKNEDNYTVWLEIASGLARLEQLLAKTSSKKYLDEKTLELFSPLVDKLGWDNAPNEPHTTTLLRSLAISRAGKSGSKKTIKTAQEKFKLMQQGKHIDPDIRGVIYSIVATYGSTKEYNALIEKYKKETLHEERNRIGGALGDFNSKDILAMASDFALSENVRIQDTVGILSSIASNPTGRDIWLKTIRKNWKVLLARYGDGGYTLGRLVKAISGSPEEKHLTEFKKFFKNNPAPGAQRSIEQVLERLASNIAWLKRDKKKLEKFFRKS